MTAAMNGSINLSFPDGWIPEFAVDKQNSFLVQPAADQSNPEKLDVEENNNLMDVIEQVVVPMYYSDQAGWLNIVKRAAKDVVPEFESSRLAAAYYETMYTAG